MRYGAGLNTTSMKELLALSVLSGKLLEVT